MRKEDMIAFQPIEINGMKLKNRLANAPFGGIPTATAEGYICDRSIDSVRELVESGVGMLTLGIIATVPNKVTIDSGNYGARASKYGQASLNDDKFIASWKPLVEYCHSQDCKLGAQLFEWGPQGMKQLSPLPDHEKKYACYMFNGTDVYPDMYTLTKEDLDDLVEQVGQAALRAKKAGLDFVELHAAHSTGLLYATSLNPFFNNRDDEYGGDLDGRLQLVLRTIRRMRELVGPDYPITIRINGDDLMGDMGNTSEDVCRYILPKIAESGVDAISVSQGGPMYETEGPLPPLYYPRGCWMHLSKAIKENTDLPVFGVGRVTTVEMAEKYLRDGCCDIFYLGRQLYADGKVIDNFLEGKPENEATRQCIGCLMSCTVCTVNYEREGINRDEYDMGSLDKVEQPKKVLVIGAGPGGLEAARVAKIKGHDVTVWEREQTLGGTVSTLATTPLLSELQNAIDYLAGQMKELDIPVRCCYEATIDRIREFGPDVVILATGTDFVLPQEVKDAPMVMTHMEAMKRKREFRSLGDWHKKVVIYGFTAAEFALDLAEAGCDVTLMGAGGDKTIGAEPWVCRERKVFLRRKLTDINYIRRSPDQRRVYNPNVLYNTRLEGVSNEGIMYYHNGIHKTIPYDVLIVSQKRKKNDDMFEELKTFVPEVYKVGDCDKIGDIHHANVSANEVARHI